MRIALFVVAVVAASMAASPVAAAQDPMIEIELECEGIGTVTVETNPVYLWVPGHVGSNDGLVTHIVTGIFGFEKGQTNDVPGIDTVLCTTTGGEIVVEGFFVPRR